jgi:paired amphipathic helix protein Sin3a
MCKEIGEKLAAEKHVSFLENPIAVELGLDDPNGPSAVLGQAMAAMGDQRAAESANVTYPYLLDACEKVFDNELDQATFEEHMRWFFGNKVGMMLGTLIMSDPFPYQAFHVFTLDKLIMALIKQVSWESAAATRMIATYLVLDADDTIGPQVSGILVLNATYSQPREAR